MATVFNKVADGWRRADMLLRLIYVNLGVFVVIVLLRAGAWLCGLNITQGLDAVLALPSLAAAAATRPWTLFSYMFAHYDPLHVAFNMIWLYWMGRIFLTYFSGKQLVGLYLLGGVGGGVLYLLSFNLLPVLAGRFATMVGASAAIMAVCGATAAYVPDFRIGMFFIGNVALKWVALALVVLDLAAISGNNNVGGHIAHIGGLAIGIWFALAIRRGTDITAWLNGLLDRLCGSRGARRPAPYTRSAAGNARPSEAQVDAVLDKIRRSGYASLTDRERQILIRASRNNR